MFCQSPAFPTEKKLEKARFCLAFLFPKKPKVFKKSQNFKIWLQKAKLATLLSLLWTVHRQHRISVMQQ